MTTNPQQAREIVAGGLAELTAIIERARETGDVQRMMATLERWKRRLTEDLRSHVSPEDASRFARISIRPNWVTMETEAMPLERHFAFLNALLEDLNRLPGRTITAESTSTLRESPGRPIVFLSHAAADHALAEFVDSSVQQGLPDHTVFRTTRVGQIPSGLPWFQHITEHLRGASKYVIVLTPSSHARPWVCFETGAAWMTGRTVVPVLGGGLTASEIGEPLKNLQLLSLEDPDQAAQAFRELGGTLVDPASFVRRAHELGQLGQEVVLRSAGWEQVDVDGTIYAWDGPLEEFTESHGVPLPDKLLSAIRSAGMRPTTGIPGDLWNEYSKGYQQVWMIGSHKRKHPVVSKDKQILLVRRENA